MICKKCGREIPNDSRICPYCGAPVIQSTASGSVPRYNSNRATTYQNAPQQVKSIVCPFCKREVVDGEFCSNCSKPLRPKWYQKNSPLTIGLMILGFAFCAFCVYLAVLIGF